MRALLDTNVVLDSLLARAPWHFDADEILRRSQPGVIDLAVSALTVANLFYIGRKLVGTARARHGVRTCLTAFLVLPIDAQTLIAADASAGSDFEEQYSNGGGHHGANRLHHHAQCRRLSRYFNPRSGAARLFGSLALIRPSRHEGFHRIRMWTAAAA